MRVASLTANHGTPDKRRDLKVANFTVIVTRLNEKGHECGLHYRDDGVFESRRSMRVPYIPSALMHPK
jgi:hypothetical protein